VLGAANGSHQSPKQATGLESTKVPAVNTPKLNQALVLAAGRGERMRPLSDTTPKPLLEVRGKPLLQWHIEALARGGVTNILINTAWLGSKIHDHFASKPIFGLNSPLSISYSTEEVDFGAALETAGGIARALPQLGSVFWVLAGDVYAPDFVFSAKARTRFFQSNMLAHLWLVPNPEHNLKGDFGLAIRAADGQQLALNLPPETTQPKFTFSTIGLYRREFFMPPLCDIPVGNPQGVKAPLVPLLRRAMDNQQVSAELYPGAWTDVGTPQRLIELNANYHP
jgi:N-acetyl-alpha-D-muramate 1-phosphate uridylyltransferase